MPVWFYFQRHLVLGLISQIIKIQLLADLNLKKTPQLVELVDDSKDVEELMSLPPEKILLRWMNFQLKKAGYKRIVTNFSTDVKTCDDCCECWSRHLICQSPRSWDNNTIRLSVSILFVFFTYYDIACFLYV
ncbi:unnamed protein product, partial [Vitis vinifera]